MPPKNPRQPIPDPSGPEQEAGFSGAEHQGRLFSPADIGHQAIEGPPTDGVHGIDAYPDLDGNPVSEPEAEQSSEIERRITESEQRRKAVFDLDAEYELRVKVNNVEKKIRGYDSDMRKVPPGDAHNARRHAITASRDQAMISKDTIGHQIREKIRNAKVALGRSIGIESSRISIPIKDDEGNIVYHEQPEDQKGKLPPKPKTKYVIKANNPEEQAILDRAFDEFYKHFSRNGDPHRHQKRTEEIDRINSEILQLDPDRPIPVRPIDEKKPKKPQPPITTPITPSQLQQVRTRLRKHR